LNKNNSKLTKVVINESIIATNINLDFLPKSIQELDLSMNKLNDIEGLLDLERLEKLNLSSCFFKCFDLSQAPKNLKRLNLRDNELTSFPLLPNNLNSELEYIDVSHNHVTVIPKEFINLKSLTEFLCSHNNLEVLPEHDFFWRGLTRLDLRNNNLRVLPYSMKNLTNLTYLDLEDNFLTEFSNFYKSSGLFRATIRLRGNSFNNEEKYKLLSLETSYLDL
jgi:Leucine-rich repeat (LRR) protein